MEDRFSLLVSKILSGEATEGDKEEFRQFLSDNPDYNLTYNQLKEYWNADVQHNLIRDKKQATDQIIAQIQAMDHSATPKRNPFRIAVAAAVLFFVTTCALLYMYADRHTSSGNMYIYAAQSVPVEYTLSDGTTVMLNKNSSITLASDYGNRSRDVKLDGEAYFMVSKDKSRPFVVETKGTKTRVLGTSFNVRSDAHEVITTLVEGSVLFASDACEEILHPNEEIRYNVQTSKYERYTCDVQMNTAWVSGRFNYSGIPFGSFANKLESIYGKKIQITDSRLANHVVSASFLIEEPIEGILDALKGELGFTYVMDGTGHIRIISK